MGTVISAFSAKGGVGKSTLATNVAVALAQETQLHVAQVDLDLQFADTALMLDVTAKSTIAEAAVSGLDRNPRAIEEHLVEHPSRLKLLAAPKSPEDAGDLSPEDVGSVPRALAAMHDYVVVDNSARIDSVTAMAMDLSTIVLLLVVPEVPALRRAQSALKLMEDSGYSPDKLKIVVNRVHRNPEISLEEITNLLNYEIYAEIPEDRAVTRSISVGVPVVMSGPRTKAGRALNELGRKLAGITTNSERSLLPKVAPWRRDKSRPSSTSPVPASGEPINDLTEAWASVISGPPRDTRETPAPADIGENDNEFDEFEEGALPLADALSHGPEMNGESAPTAERRLAAATINDATRAPSG